MKRLVLCSIIILVLFSATNVLAQEKGKHTPASKSPEEIMRYVRDAVALVQEKGKGAYDELTDPEGPWVSGDWYIYVNNFDGYIEAHLNRKLVGKNMYGVRDIKETLFMPNSRKMLAAKGDMVGLYFGGPNLIQQCRLKR